MTEEYGIARGLAFSLESIMPALQRTWLVEAASTSRRWQLSCTCRWNISAEFLRDGPERFPSLVKEGEDDPVVIAEALRKTIMTHPVLATLQIAQ